MRVVLNETSHQFPELDPPDELIWAWESARTISSLIEQGVIEYSPEGIRRWQRGGMSQQENLKRQLMVSSVKRMLRGRRIAEADAALVEGYREHLRGARQRGAAMAVRHCIRRGATIEEFPTPLITILTSQL